ncbi:MAG: cytidylate kinase family protein [Candidatus Levybacteria bacterium]|nr:cytidylate kinase family protein [Candidatus Levybacteria bacterium]
MREHTVTPHPESQKSLHSPENFRPLVDVITISGPAGTGKTVVGEALAPRYNMDFVKVGQKFRQDHRLRTGQEVVGYAERDVDVDREMDQMQVEIVNNAAHADKKVVLEGRLAHIIATEEILRAESEGRPRPNIVRVLFTADPMIRAMRVQKRYPDLTPEEALAKNAEREEGDLARWRSLHPLIPEDKDIYAVDLQNENGEHPFFDLIVDTSDMTQEQTVESLHQRFLENNIVVENLSPEHALDIFYASFKFSQGGPALQKDMLQYIANEHPEWRMGDDEYQQIFDAFLQKATAYLAHTAQNNAKKVIHPDFSDSIETETKERLDEFRNILNSPRVPVSLHEIMKTIIEKDFRFLADAKSGEAVGRPRTDNGTTFLSHICHYVMKGEATGSPEFDQMFEDIFDHIQRGGLINLDWDEDARLTKVIEFYNAFHPDGKREPAFIAQE